MTPGNPQQPLVLLLAVVITGGVVAMIDIVLLVRWLIYQVHLHDYEILVRAHAAAAQRAIAATQAADGDTGPDEDAFERAPDAAIGTGAAEAGIQAAERDAVAVADAPVGPSDEPPDAALPASSAAAEDTADSGSFDLTGPAAPLSDQAPAVVDPVFSPPKPPFARAWSLTHPFLALQGVVLVLTVGVAAAMIVKAKVRPAHPGHAAHLGELPMWLIITMLVLQDVLFVGAVAFALRMYGTSLRAIGLRRPTFRLVALGLALGGALLYVSNVAGNGLEAAVQHLVSPGVWRSLRAATDAAAAEGMFMQIKSPWAELAFAIAGSVAAPIGEEVFFRGFVYNALRVRLNVPAAIVLSGLAFAFIHFSILGLPVLWMMGMVLAYVYERTQSLWVTIAMHAGNNGGAFVLLWLVQRHLIH